MLRTLDFKLPLFKRYNVPPLSIRISYYWLSAEEDLCQFALFEFSCQPMHQHHPGLCILKLIPCPFCSSPRHISRKIAKRT